MRCVRERIDIPTNFEMLDERWGAGGETLAVRNHISTRSSSVAP